MIFNLFILLTILMIKNRQKLFNFIEYNYLDS